MSPVEAKSLKVIKKYFSRQSAPKTFAYCFLASYVPEMVIVWCDGYNNERILVF